jgi:hypothetical protein
MLLLSLTVGCKAQIAATSAPDPALNRRIEILVRSQFDLPADVTLSIGARKPSQFTGYETLPITITHNGKPQEFDFLISDDSTKLLHMDSMDLTKDPADAIPIAGRPMRGNPAAKVTVARMQQELFPVTLDHYKNLVRYVYKDDPLTDLHPWAMRAAVDANCLAAQSATVYWAYVDYLHAHGDEVSGDQRDVNKSFAALDRIARQEATVSKLDETALDACIAKQDETLIKVSVKLADSLGIDGTPAVYVNGEKVNGGAVPVDQLWMVIDRALRSVGQEPPHAPPAAAGQSGGQ